MMLVVESDHETVCERNGQSSHLNLCSLDWALHSGRKRVLVIERN